MISALINSFEASKIYSLFALQARSLSVRIENDNGDNDIFLGSENDDGSGGDNKSDDRAE